MDPKRASDEEEPSAASLTRGLAPAVVLGCLNPGELTVTVLPGCGLADGGFNRAFAINLFPADLRMPNDKVWLRFNDQMNLIEVLPRQQIEKIAAESHQRARSLPAWWGPVSWVALCLAAKLVSLGMQMAMQRSLLAGGSLLTTAFYVWSHFAAAFGSLSGTAPIFAGLWSGLAPGGLTSRVTGGLVVVVAMSCITAPVAMLLTMTGNLITWGLWFAIGVFVRVKVGVIFSADGPSATERSPRWTVADLMILTTVGSAIAAIAGVVFQSTSAGTPAIAGLPNIGWFLASLIGAPLGALAMLPVLWGLFPLDPHPPSVRRVVGGAMLTIAATTALSLVWIVYLGAAGWDWNTIGRAILISSISGEFYFVASLVAGGLWLRWWGYRLRPLSAGE